MDDNVGAESIARARARLPLVVMGPAGCGKTTVARRLAEILEVRFVDADQHHSAENIRKMRAGVSLTDADRAPWLERLRSLLENEPKTVLACSALKRSYRTALIPATTKATFLFLDVPAEELERRLKERVGHYAGANLLRSQLSTLERPSNETNTLRIDGSLDLEEIISSALLILGRLNEPTPSPDASPK